LVNPAGLEAGGKIDMRVRRQDGPLRTLIVEPTAAFDAGKLPVCAGHNDARIARIAAAGQAGFGGVARRRWMTAGWDAAAQWIDRDARLVSDELHAHRPSDRPAMVGSDWEVEYLSPAAGKQITLPGEPNDRVTAPHEEAVAGVGQGPWVVGSGRIVEKLQ